MAAKGVKTVAPACEKLVSVGLVADVPYDAVDRRIENIVERDGQFYDSQVGSQVAAVRRDSAYDRIPDLVCQLLQLRQGQLPQLGRLVDLGKKVLAV